METPKCPDCDDIGWTMCLHGSLIPCDCEAGKLAQAFTLLTTAMQYADPRYKLSNKNVQNRPD